MKKIGIVGAGPNGIYAAQKLVKFGFDVTLFEAGYLNHESLIFNRNQYKFETPSQMPEGVHKVGGGSSKWHGRYGPFTRVDFTRNWYGRSWKIQFEDLDSHYKQVEEFLSDGNNLFKNSTSQSTPDLENRLLQFWRIRVHKFCNKERFQKEIISLQNYANFRLLEGHIAERFGNSGSSIELTLNVDNQKKTMNFDTLLIAAGTIQSTKLVYKSISRIKPDKQSGDLIASSLMEHVEGPIGSLVLHKTRDHKILNIVLDANNCLRGITSEWGVSIEMSRYRSMELTELTNQFELRQDTFQLSKWIAIFRKYLLHRESYLPIEFKRVQESWMEVQFYI